SDERATRNSCIIVTGLFRRDRPPADAKRFSVAPVHRADTDPGGRDFERPDDMSRNAPIVEERALNNTPIALQPSAHQIGGPDLEEIGKVIVAQEFVVRN